MHSDRSLLTCVPLELLQDTGLSTITITPHWSSSYLEYLSPHWDTNTQCAVVWTRLQEHCKLANHSLAKVNKRFRALRQEQQATQVKSSHESLSCDNLPYQATRKLQPMLHPPVPESVLWPADQLRPSNSLPKVSGVQGLKLAAWEQEYCLFHRVFASELSCCLLT